MLDFESVESIRELLIRNGLSRIAPDVEAAALPSVFLTATEPSEGPCCRLGGRPNLPPDLGWPAWRGRPLSFVSQLDLTAIAQADALGLPQQGSLYFFYEGGREAWGFDPEERGCSQVIYSPGSLREHPLRQLPEDLDADLRFPGVRLDPGAMCLSLPAAGDQVLLALDLNREESDAYWECYEEWRQSMPPTDHRVGGHPEPIQDDPKLHAQLASHGIGGSGSNSIQRGRELGLLPGAAEWQLLLQVGSEEAAEMMWGDVGLLYFLIHRSDLAQRRFERAWLVLQCG